MKKICARCKLSLDFSEFNWKIKNIKKASYCKKCSREYIKSHYESNREYYLNKAKNRNSNLKQILQKYLIEYLKTHPCVDCGEINLLTLEFDHRERGKKSYNVSYIMRNSMTLNHLIIEINKCDVRCANCHRIKTEKEIKSWKLEYMRQ